jgi:hypothetical protein
MKIGIISNQQHCKTHLRQLQADGYEVYCIGADPQTIPPSYDALIVRTGSMAHNKTPTEWGKITGRPVIYEEGLSGMRRELGKLRDAGGQVNPPTAAISVQEVRDKMIEWGSALVEARPNDRRSDLARNLKRTLQEQYPSMSSDSKALVASVVGQLFAMLPVVATSEETPVDLSVEEHTTHIPPRTPLQPCPPLGSFSITPILDTTPTPDTPQQESAPPMLSPEYLENIQYPTQSMPFTSIKDEEGNHPTWCALYSPSKLKVAYEEAWHLDDTMNEKDKEDFLRAYIQKAERDRNIQKRLVRLLKPEFERQPLKYVMFLYLALPDDHEFVKSALFKSYQQITGKGPDTRLAYAVAWYLGRDTPPNAPAAVKAIEARKPSKPPTAQKAEAPLPAMLVKAAEVDVELEGYEGEVVTTKAMEVMDNTPTILGLLDTVETLTTELVEVRAELKTCVRTIDGTPVPTAKNANPLAMLDEVKDRLREMGFRGTWTLTIE